MALKAINSEVEKKLLDHRIKHAPEVYKYCKSRVKNKTLNRALESDIANYAARKAEKNLFNLQNG